MSIFVILPHQLFNKKHLNREYNYILWEHPHYFKTYKYNKKKIILHKASMEYYYDYLKKNKFKCSYINLNEKFTHKKYTLFDPIDNIKLPYKYTIIETPNFILDKSYYGKYRDRTKNFFFNAFYMWGKKQKNIIPKVKSLDKENRNKLPKNIVIPKIPSNNSDDKYIKKGIKFVNKYFPNNYGNTKDFIYPITHKTAKKFITHFVLNKLKNFGKYQDAIDMNNNYLFHSILSSSINIGLLNPIDVIKIILKAKAPMNSIEGFIRQLFWREYQRYCYIYCNFNKNYFGNKKKLTKEWYTGNTGCTPVDNCIINGFNSGYLHHIERLMVVGNYMNLNRISPKEGYKWFMEFSCDSYDWVMHQNVLDMVFFVTGGKTMRRPYISSSNYILKMSNYKKNEWADNWDDLYKTFVKSNKKKLYKFRYYFSSFFRKN